MGASGEKARAPDEPDESDEPDEPVSFEEALDRTGDGRYNHLLVATCSLVLLGIGVDLFGFSLVVTAACDLGLSVAEKGILTSIPFVGILVTSLAWGLSADRWGRRRSLVAPLMASFALSCASCLAPHWLALGLAKFLSVCFGCAANSATYTLVGESCARRLRPRYLLLMTCLIILSPAVAAMIAYPTLKLAGWGAFPAWRLLALLLALPTGLGAGALYFFHESPKFLFARGRREEALRVLAAVHRANHRGRRRYQVRNIAASEEEASGPEAPLSARSLPRALLEQAARLFRAPYLRRSLQLYYIIGVVYITNNSFLVWLPHVMNLVRVSLEGEHPPGGVCALIAPPAAPARNISLSAAPPACISTIERNVVATLVGSQCLFSCLNLAISWFPRRRRALLVAVLGAAGAGGAGAALAPEPVSGVLMLLLLTATCLGMGILASYFVELYPTSYRGMASCLSVMVGRSCAFVGINLVAGALFSHCRLTFGLWSLLVLSAAAVACFLPPDAPAAAEPPPHVDGGPSQRPWRPTRAT